MKKLNNKILLISLLVLAAIFAASRLFRSSRLESNVRKELIDIDTASVTEIRIKPSEEGAEEFKMVRQGSAWTVAQGKRQGSGDAGAIKGMLGSLADIKAQRMASRKKEKWEEFNVGEKGTHVTAYAGGSKVVDVHIGKTGFNQGQGGGGGGGNFMGGAYTYVRLSDEDETYVVDGFLESTFNRSLSDWRNRAVLRLKKEDIAKITFTYPDSGFVVQKKDSLWVSGADVLDNNKVDGFLSQIAFRNLNDFEEVFQPVGNATAVMQVEGTAGTLATVQAWKKEDGQWAIQSSVQPDVLFSAAHSAVSNDLLIGKKKLMK